MTLRLIMNSKTKSVQHLSVWAKNLDISASTALYRWRKLFGDVGMIDEKQAKKIKNSLPIGRKKNV